MKNTLNEADLRELFAQSSEVKMHTYASQQQSQTRSVLLIYCEGMADSMRIQQFILPQLEQMLNSSPSIPKGSAGVLMDLWPILPEQRNELSTLVYSGQLILFFEEDSSLYTLDIANPPQRKPEESSTEVSIKGPRDAFTEEVSTNIALVRKRLRSPSMCTEQFIVGRRSHTKVALLYIRDIISSEIIDEVRSRIQALDIDALLSSSQLQELIGDTSYPLFPLMDDIGRPDYVAESLIRGRFAILVDGAPMALLAPSNLMGILKSPEDMHLPFHYVSLERLLRLIGLLISIYLPGFWIAVSSFNLDQIPFPLLATITSSRLGLPLSGPIDFYLIIGLFELFREAGVRLPKAVGQTVAVVGGLIIGDAAIRAGFTSPSTLVVTAVSMVSTFTLVNQSLSGTVTLLRIFVLICSSILGMYGFFISMFSIVLYVSSQESFGVPYLAPLSPPRFKEWFQALFTKPIKNQTKRPSFLPLQDTTRQEESP